MSTRRYIGIGLSVALLAMVGYYFSDIITWICLGWIVSMLGLPLMNLLGKIRIGQRQLPASLRAFMVLSVFLGTLVLLVSMIVPVVMQQGRNLAGVNYAAIMEGLDEPLSRTNDWLIQRGIIDGPLSKYNAPSTNNKAAKPAKEQKEQKEQKDPKEQKNSTAQKESKDSTAQKDSKDSTQKVSPAPKIDSISVKPNANPNPKNYTNPSQRVADLLESIKSSKANLNTNPNPTPNSNPNNYTNPKPNLTYIAADTINIIVQATDSSQNGKNNTILTKASIPLDSLLQYDKVSGEHSARNVQFNIKVAMQGLPTWNELHPAIIPHDVTAIEKPDDSPLEKTKKRLFSFINPSALIGSAASYIINFFGNFLILVTSVSFIAFFFLQDEKLFGRSIKGILPDTYAVRTDSALSEIRRLLTRYFGGILLQIFMIAIFVSTCLWFLGIENGILIGFFAAFANIIPYIGPFIGGIFALLVTISSSLHLDFYTEMLPLLGKVALIFVVMQGLDNFLLQPIIFSNSVLAHPLEIFIVVITGAKLGGIFGMIVALPIYTVFRVIAATFLNEFKIVQQLTQHLKHPDEDEEARPKATSELPPKDLQ